MKNLIQLILIALALISWQCQNRLPQKNDILHLHPENPNYFLYKGKPTILVTSGEHYGAVMNADFDYVKYLQALKEAGLNYTRIFTGPYSEMGDKTFGIVNNTMNPKPENWLTAWAKDATGKYNLEQWNPAYFERLKTFVTKADELGIVVEITLFTSYYSNYQWSTSPFNPKNNLQNTDSITYKQVNTVNNGSYMKFQENYVRKMVQELNSFGNLFFEIQNEPWADNPQLVTQIAETDTLTHPFAWQRLVETAKTESLQWQKQIAQIIADEESRLPNQHLIAQNISNFGTPIANADPNISVFNFHYAYPEAAMANLSLNKVIGLDETGFMPHDDIHYRSQAWKFMLAGGALYNNLDYSFTVGHEDGSYPVDAGTPGWSHAGYRSQLKFLKSFMESLDFIRMKPDNTILKVVKGNLKDYQIFAEKGKKYAIYLQGNESVGLQLSIPDGKYTANWIDPVSGEIKNSVELESTENTISIESPAFQEDIVLLINSK